MIKYSFYGFATAAMAFLTVACVHKEYDFLHRPVDTNVTILANSTIPIGNFKPLTLKDIYFREQYEDTITEDAAGNLSYVFKGAPVSHRVDLPVFVFENIVRTGSVQIPLPSFDFPVAPVPGIIFPSGGYPVPADRTVFPIKLESGGIASEITALKHAAVESEGSFKIAFDGLPVSRLFIAKGSRIKLPQFVELNGIPDGFVRNDRNELIFSRDCSVASGKGIHLKFAISGIDFTKMKDGQGLVRPGFFSLDDEVALDLKVFVKGDDIVSSVPGSPAIHLGLEMTDIRIVSVEARLEPKIEMEIPPVELGNLTTLFKGQNPVLDIRGLRLDMVANNPFPVGADLSASLISHTPDGNTASTETGPVTVRPEGFTRLSLSEEGAVFEDGFRGVAVPGLDELAYRVPQRISIRDFKVDTGKDFCRLVLGQTYNFGVTYSVNVPLSFGPALDVKFEYDFPFSFEEIGKMASSFVLKMKAVSSVPVNQSINAVGLDANGEIVNDVEIKCTSGIAAGTLSAPAESDVSLEISASDSFTSLAAIRLYLGMQGSDKEISIFNSNQSLTWKNVSVSYPDGINLEFVL